jgi:hypothetical protein
MAAFAYVLDFVLDFSFGCHMPAVISNAFASTLRRPVSITRDGEDFVVSLQPENIVIFRHGEANALRRICSTLRWDIVHDAARDTTGHGGSI